MDEVVRKVVSVVLATATTFILCCDIIIRFLGCILTCSRVPKDDLIEGSAQPGAERVFENNAVRIYAVECDADEK